jgi:hypothetical protein
MVQDLLTLIYMKTVLIVSKCLKAVRLDRDECWYHFHFKGVCAGEELRRVILKGKRDGSIRKDHEYLLYVQLVSFEEGALIGNIVKSKALDECWDMT